MGTPQLNIKDTEATHFFSKRTDLTGESQTEAVRTALREHLQRARAEHEAQAARKRKRRAANSKGCGPG